MAIVLEGNLHDHFFAQLPRRFFSQAGRRHARKNRTKLGETEEEIEKNGDR